MARSGLVLDARRIFVNERGVGALPRLAVNQRFECSAVLCWAAFVLARMDVDRSIHSANCAKRMYVRAPTSAGSAAHAPSPVNRSRTRHVEISIDGSPGAKLHNF
jgi:hypothetical protein